MFKPLSVFNRNRTSPALTDDDGAPFFQLHREMNRLFDDFFSDFGAPAAFAGQGGNGARAIHVDFKDNGKALEIEAELPGVDEDNVDVELHDNLLTIRGERKDEEEKEGVSRRSYASFQRSMSLPFDVDPDAIEAKFKNGVLKLILPKPPELEARTKKIAVQRG
ncbi:Hsp20/alpha crystallin family protein [Marinicaulis aureus]|uniref:Hsp20/alpha crystallin family protein n=1 Tax=Hyphococcus aureus TaxID=2666033 RepID=A0ABW1KRE6_9PROT